MSETCMSGCVAEKAKNERRECEVQESLRVNRKRIIYKVMIKNYFVSKWEN